MLRFRRLLVTGLTLVAAGALIAAEEPPTNESARADQVDVVKGNNSFALELYAQLRHQEGNLFLSPNSISTALAMTYTGARNQTAEQMASVLHLTLEPDRLNKAYASLIRELNGPIATTRPREFQLHIANALWGQKGHPFREEFTRTLRAEYGARLRLVDFRQVPEAVEAVNSWVASETRDKIKNLLAPDVLTPETRLVLTNAIYFKGTWSDQFHKNQTQKEAFHLTVDQKVDVPLMHQTEHYRFLETGQFQALELPYRGGASMTIFLPKKLDGLAAFEATLTRDNLLKWLGQLRHEEVQVALPRFKTTAEFNLKDVLSKMGMAQAFQSGAADFSGMDDKRDLFLSAVIHKAFVDVNEEGTEAAAATAVIVKRAEAPVPTEPKVFRADHPFVFMVRDGQTNSILFMGRVLDPRDKK
jgi:serpin B